MAQNIKVKSINLMEPISKMKIHKKKSNSENRNANKQIYTYSSINDDDDITEFSEKTSLMAESKSLSYLSVNI